VIIQLEAYRYINQDWPYKGARANAGLSEPEMSHALKRRSWNVYEEWKDWRLIKLRDFKEIKVEKSRSLNSIRYDMHIQSERSSNCHLTTLYHLLN
jgi:hypothetical protein